MLLTGCLLDKEPPKIKIDKDYLTIKQASGTYLNLKSYFRDKVTVTDNKDTDVSYKISADKNYYDKESGKVNTDNVVEFKGKIIAEDKSGNKSNKKFTVKITSGTFYSNQDYGSVKDCNVYKNFSQKNACYDYKIKQNDKNLEELKNNIDKVKEQNETLYGENN